MNERDLLERLIEEASSKGFVKHQLDDALAALRTAGEATAAIEMRVDGLNGRTRALEELAKVREQHFIDLQFESSRKDTSREAELKAMNALLDALYPFFRQRKFTRKDRARLMVARADALKLYSKAQDEIIPF